MRRGALRRLPLEELPSSLGGQPRGAVAAAQRGSLVGARRPGHLRVLLLGPERLPGSEPATVLRNENLCWPAFEGKAKSRKIVSKFEAIEASQNSNSGLRFSKFAEAVTGCV